MNRRLPEGHHYRVAEFGPSEAARITGVSTIVQRDWRRRGVIQAREGKGWTKFAADMLPEMMIRRELGDTGLGVGSEFESLFLVSAGVHVLSFAMREPGVVDFEGDIPEEEREWPGSYPLPPDGQSEKPQWRFLVVRNPPLTVSNPKTGGTLAKFGNLWPCVDEAEVFEKMRQKAAGEAARSATIIDLREIALTLVRRAERPLMTVVAGPKPGA